MTTEELITVLSQFGASVIGLLIGFTILFIVAAATKDKKARKLIAISIAIGAFVLASLLEGILAIGAVGVLFCSIVALAVFS